MKEIISLQLGNTANYIGSHYWNIVGSYFDNQPDLLSSAINYREGLVGGEVTYTPRLISLDLKGCRGSLSTQESAEVVPRQAWDGKVDKIEMDEIKKNNYLKSLGGSTSGISHSEYLTKTVRYWSDYLGEVPSYTHEDDRNQFRFFNQGKSVMRVPDMENEVMDERIRKYMEECDSAQGFQIITSSDDGFSGASATIVETLREEYGKKSILVFGVAGESTRMSQVNQTLLMNSMHENEAIYVPLHTPKAFSERLSPNLDSLYQTSAYLAAAIESITLPFKLKAASDRKEMAEIQAILSSKTSTFALALGFPSVSKDQIFDINKQGSKDGSWPWSRDLTLQSATNIKSCLKSFNVFRGFQESLTHQTLQPNQIGAELKAMLVDHLSELSPNATICIQKSAFPLTDSYPQFFVDTIDQYGLDTRTRHTKVDSIALQVSLHNNLDPVYKQMAQNVTFKSTDGVLMSDFETGEFGIDVYEWKDIKEHFVELCSNNE